MARVGSVRNEGEQMQSFAEGLEQRARDAISSDSSWEVEGFSVSSILKDEIALTLQQLSGLRASIPVLGLEANRPASHSYSQESH